MGAEEKAEPKSAKAASKRTLLLVLLLVVALLGGGYFFFLKEEPAPPAPKTPPRQVKKIPKPTPPAPAKTKIAAPAAKAPASIEPKAVPPLAEQAPPPKPEHYYTVEQGDTLWAISGLPEVYGDHEMWRALYLANPEVISYFYRKKEVPYVILAKGVRLRVPEKDQAERLLTSIVNTKLWVVQLSANLNLPYALALADRLNSMGANVYVMEDASTYPTWYVTRVGFFENKDKAHARAKVILSETGLTEYLVRPASDHEIQQYLPFAARAE